MARSNANIRTLRDIAGPSLNASGYKEYTENPTAADAATHQAAAEGLPPSSGKAPTCHYISTLNSADFAKSLLERVVAEFLPIIQRRQYNVHTVSEMCCCGDGLDTKRKQKRMGNNVWGYNQTISRGSRKSHEIHLRLRHVQAHQSRFLPYEDVAGTMAHELAHCERGPHDKKFFEIMEGILDEHASLMASRLNPNGTLKDMPSGVGTSAAATSSLSSFDGAGQRLGGSSAGSNKSRLLQQQQGRKLGGTKSAFQTPGQAAAAAARQRQLRLAGTRCCRPCVIEILDSDEENSKPKATSSTMRNGLVASAKRGAPTSSKQIVVGKKRSKTPTLIDLTADDDGVSPEPSPVNVTDWVCAKCTYINTYQATACDMCRAPRP